MLTGVDMDIVLVPPAQIMLIMMLMMFVWVLVCLGVVVVVFSLVRMKTLVVFLCFLWGLLRPREPTTYDFTHTHTLQLT